MWLFYQYQYNNQLILFPINPNIQTNKYIEATYVNVSWSSLTTWFSVSILIYTLWMSLSKGEGSSATLARQISQACISFNFQLLGLAILTYLCFINYLNWDFKKTSYSVRSCIAKPRHSSCSLDFLNYVFFWFCNLIYLLAINIWLHAIILLYLIKLLFANFIITFLLNSIYLYPLFSYL